VSKLPILLHGGSMQLPTQHPCDACDGRSMPPDEDPVVTVQERTWCMP
jgi:hypothetical protein